MHDVSGEGFEFPFNSMKSFAEALLIVSEVWESTDWQVRTTVVGRPWDPPRKFDSNVSTMSEEDAKQSKALVDALKRPDTVLGPNLKQKQKDKAATAQRQTDVYNKAQFAEARVQWKKWVRDHSKPWQLNMSIDTWAESLGVGCDDLIRLSGSREVSNLLPYS